MTFSIDMTLDQAKQLYNLALNTVKTLGFGVSKSEYDETVEKYNTDANTILSKEATTTTTLDAAEDEFKRAIEWLMNEGNQFHAAMLLLQNQNKLNTIFSNGIEMDYPATILAVACYNLKLEEAKWLLENGANANTLIEGTYLAMHTVLEQNQPLDYAEHNTVAILELLFKNNGGTQLNAIDTDEHCANPDKHENMLTGAIKSLKPIDVITCLLNHGAKVISLQQWHDGTNTTAHALEVAAEYSNFDIFSKLYDKGLEQGCEKEALLTREVLDIVRARQEQAFEADEDSDSQRDEINKILKFIANNAKWLCTSLTKSAYRGNPPHFFAAQPSSAEEQHANKPHKSLISP